MRSQGWVHISSEISGRLSPRDFCKRPSCPSGSQKEGTSPTWHWPLGGTCASHIPEEHQELGRSPRGKAVEKIGGSAWGHSCPDFTVQGAPTRLPCDRVLSTGGEALQAQVRQCDEAGNSQFPGGSDFGVSGAASPTSPHFVIESTLWGGYDFNFPGETEA